MPTYQIAINYNHDYIAQAILLIHGEVAGEEIIGGEVYVSLFVVQLLFLLSSD